MAGRGPRSGRRSTASTRGWRPCTRKRTGEEERASLRQAALNPFADWKAHYEKAETVAEEVVQEKPCYKVVFTPSEGRTLNAYFEKETGLLVRQELVSEAGSKRMLCS